MKRQVQEIRYFINGQAFADGFRTTFAILLPSLVAVYFDQFEVGMVLSLSALCVSITDAPGPFVHKRNGMLVCCVLLFITAVLTAWSRTNNFLMGAEVLAYSFFFSMFAIFGGRATAVGTAAILFMILQMDTPVPNNKIIEHGLLVLCGGLWYLTVSLLAASLQPYRTAQRRLGDCIREVAGYLSIKSDFYNCEKNLEQAYRKLLVKQVSVHEKQEEVREILFKTRQIVDESTAEGRKLVMTFVETVDLFEDITATYYDYASLRKRFGKKEAFAKIALLINEIAAELDNVGIAVQRNSSYSLNTLLEKNLIGLKEQLDELAKTELESSLVLKKILVNLRRLFNRYKDLIRYFTDDIEVKKSARLDHAHFATRQSINWKVFADNLTLESTVFRHALRVAVSCLVGFVLVKTLHYGQHSYWVLLTIAFILKPAFSLTKQRNIERIVGTIAGGAVGILILAFIPNVKIQFAFMVLFMLGTYSFLRTNYLYMVVCTTPFILILFNLTGFAFYQVATERLLDTAIGCAIAFSASYFLFPSWESNQIQTPIDNMLKANAAYLKKILEGLDGKPISLLEYRLVRKEVYVSSANLSAAFQRMLSEPRSKRNNSKHLHQFVVLNHILFSNIATVVTGFMRRQPKIYPTQLYIPVRKALALLSVEDSHKELADPMDQTKKVVAGDYVEDDDSRLLKDQLEYIQHLSADINKTLKKINAQ